MWNHLISWTLSALRLIESGHQKGLLLFTIVANAYRARDIPWTACTAARRISTLNRHGQDSASYQKRCACEW